MKLIKTLLIVALYFTTHNIITEHQAPLIDSTHNALPLISDLKTAKTTSLCRLALLPSLLIIVAYMHQGTIARTIYNNPVSFLAMSYLLGNYLIDTVAKYQRINHTLRFLLLSHTMNRYMLCAFAIKNNFLQQHKSNCVQFNEQQFFEKIIVHTGYTIEELEIFTTELIHQSLSAIHDISLNKYQDQTNDHLYFLLKDKITIEQIMTTSKQDPILYQALLNYTKNPETEHESVLEAIGMLMKQQINSFIKKNLHIFPQVR